MKALIVVCIIIGAADAVVSIGLRGAAAAAGAAVPGLGLGGKAADKGGGVPSPTGGGAAGDGDAPEEWEVAFPDTPYEGKAKEEFLAFKKQSRLEEEEFYKGEPLDPKVQALKAKYAAEVNELLNKNDPEAFHDLLEKPSPEEEDPFLKMAHEYATNPNVPTPEGLKPGPNGPATVGMVFEKAKKAKKLGALRPDRLLRKFLGQLREVSGNAQHWVCKYFARTPPLAWKHNAMGPTHAGRGNVDDLSVGWIFHIGATTRLSLMVNWGVQYYQCVGRHPFSGVLR